MNVNLNKYNPKKGKTNKLTYATIVSLYHSIIALIVINNHKF